MQPERMLETVADIALAAGEAILDVYDKPVDVVEKDDGSPLTVADRRAHRLIVKRLRELDTAIPVLSEESPAQEVADRRQWRSFWLVDPLDGTKEFIRRNGEFTVNIALVEDGAPVLGVVHTPVRRVTHLAVRGGGATRRDDHGSTPIRCRPFDSVHTCMVASRSHAGEAVTRYREALQHDVAALTTVSMGSALKICLVAEGSADIYPRLGPTSEWDTAASHCVINEAGGRLVDTDGRDLVYNKASLLNPFFLAIGDPRHDWLQYLPEKN